MTELIQNPNDNKEETNQLNPEINKTENMPRRSRLSKNFQKKSRNTFLLSILGIIIILFLLFRYGLPLISDASFIFGRVTSTNKDEVKIEEKQAFVPIPILDSLPKATNDKTILVSGSSISGIEVDIFLNGKKIEAIKADENGDFAKEITLSDGENIIKAKAKKNTAESDFSKSIIVVFKKEGPEVTISSPSEGAQISGANPIEIRGNSDPDSNVLVNDFQAIVNSKGEWSYFLTLKGGDNEIKVISTDLAGNKTEKIIHVNYSQ